MRKILTATLAAGTLVAGFAHAAGSTATTTFQVSATVQATCSATANPLNFNTYVPGNGNVTANTTINVKCTNGTAYTVALNGGSTSGGTIGQRLMANGTNTLQYNLYTNATWTTLFGDGTTSGSKTDGGTGAGTATVQSYTVYGQLPDNTTNQAAIPGTYADTIQVTIAY